MPDLPAITRHLLDAISRTHYALVNARAYAEADPRHERERQRYQADGARFAWLAAGSILEAGSLLEELEPKLELATAKKGHRDGVRCGPHVSPTAHRLAWNVCRLILSPVMVTVYDGGKGIVRHPGERGRSTEEEVTKWLWPDIVAGAAEHLKWFDAADLSAKVQLEEVLFASERAGAGGEKKKRKTSRGKKLASETLSDLTEVQKRCYDLFAICGSFAEVSRTLKIAPSTASQHIKAADEKMVRLGYASITKRSPHKTTRLPHDLRGQAEIAASDDTRRR